MERRGITAEVPEVKQINNVLLLWEIFSNTLCTLQHNNYILLPVSIAVDMQGNVSSRVYVQLRKMATRFQAVTFVIFLSVDCTKH